MVENQSGSTDVWEWSSQKHNQIEILQRKRKSHCNCVRINNRTASHFLSEKRLCTHLHEQRRLWTYFLNTNNLVYHQIGVNDNNWSMKQTQSDSAGREPRYKQYINMNTFFAFENQEINTNSDTYLNRRWSLLLLYSVIFQLFCFRFYALPGKTKSYSISAPHLSSEMKKQIEILPSSQEVHKDITKRLQVISPALFWVKKQCGKLH